MSRAATSYHPMATAPEDGTMVRLHIRQLYVGCPTEVFGWWDGAGWVSDQPLDSSRNIEPMGWAEL
jgi:hypothetical protein